MAESKLVRVIHKVAAFIEGRSYRPGDTAVIDEKFYSPEVHDLAPGETLTPVPTPSGPPHPAVVAVQAVVDELAATKKELAALKAPKDAPPAAAPTPPAAPVIASAPSTEGAAAADAAPAAATAAPAAASGGAT